MAKSSRERVRDQVRDLVWESALEHTYESLGGPVADSVGHRIWAGAYARGVSLVRDQIMAYVEGSPLFQRRLQRFYD